MPTMKAVRIHAYGGPEVLRYEDVPLPERGADDVIVRVFAAAVNPVDWRVREGQLKKFIDYPLPMIPGWDVSGTIEALGPDAAGFAEGDAVYARPDIQRNGAYAEFIAVRASEIAKKPNKIDHVHAAAIPLAGLTAWQALVQAPSPYSGAELKAGQTILIHGAAGGVGTFAVQIAKWRGARIIGTSSANNAQFLRGLGVDEVIDYAKNQFEDLVKDVDVVFDTIGGDTQTRSWKCLKKGGTLVSIASRPSEELAREHEARAAYVFIQPNAGQLAELAGLVDDGKIEPIISEVIPLAEARRAQELSQGGHVRGKVVLRVRD